MLCEVCTAELDDAHRKRHETPGVRSQRKANMKEVRMKIALSHLDTRLLCEKNNAKSALVSVLTVGNVCKV